MMELFEEYAKRFGDGFPMIPLGFGRTEEEVNALIKRCLEEGKDAYELGLVEDDDEVIY